MSFTDLEMALEVRFQNLQPFVNYTVAVFATNGFGGGASASHDFMTLGSKLMCTHVLELLECRTH